MADRPPTELTGRALIEAAATAIKSHEAALVDAMLNGTGGLVGLGHIPSVSVLGPVNSEHRAGMVSFEIESVPAATVVEQLGIDGVRAHVRKRDHYSASILIPLGVEACVRASVCHYNSLAEVEQLLATVNRLAG